MAEDFTQLWWTETPDAVAVLSPDGRVVARRLKEDPRTQAIPIVVVTAFPELYSPEDLREVGCELCIVKPIDTRENPRMLEKVVEARQRSLPEKS